MGAACRSLRYELLMFLFAFEVNDAQDTCTCKFTGGATGGVYGSFESSVMCTV